MYNISKYSRRTCCFYSFFFFQILSIFSQHGNYFVQNFLPTIYQASANNSGITQNNNGVIFIANNDGVLIYDGINWDQCKRIDEISIVSIAKTNSGEIVVGTSDGDIATIKKNQKGKFQYRSLLDRIPEQKRPREIIRQIVTIGPGTYFLSADKLVEYKNARLKIYEPTESFHSRMLVMGKHLFVCDVNKHLNVLENGTLKPVTGTEDLSREKYFFCYKLNAATYAIGYRNTGMYIANYDSIHPTETKFIKKASRCDIEFARAEINNGCLLRNGNYLVTTNKKGAFELDSNLNIVNRFNSQNGIYDDNIKSAFQDENGNLWLALYYGVAFVETNSSLFQYTRSNGITGVVQSAAYFEHKLFIATDKGIQYYDTLVEQFKIFEDFNKQCWFLYPSKDRLFIGSDKGLFYYKNGKIEQLSENKTFCILSEPHEPNILYVASSIGLEIYWLNKDKVNLITKYPLYRQFKCLASDASGNIYAVSEDHLIYFLNYMKPTILDSVPQRDGLPPQYFETYLFSYKGKLLMGTDSGIYSLENKAGNGLRCIKNPEFWSQTKGSQIFRATQFGNAIICSQKYLVREKDELEEKITMLEKVMGSQKICTRKINHLSDITPTLISFDTVTKVTFICSNEGLFILNSKINDQKKHFMLSVKKFFTKTDTLMENCSTNKQLTDASIAIPYKSNDVTVLLGFTSYETSSIEFSYMLEGRDNVFTKWEKENRLSFSNLREGNYTLKIKARTELEDKIYTLEIPFKILPPWYRSVYAYIIYFILFIAFVYAVVKLNSRRLVAQNKKLEQTIEERTSTISTQKEEIEHKQKEIIDSINYAQRIQRALLASDKLLNENLPDYFVFFQPKDVVSGDFYWAAKIVISSGPDSNRDENSNFVLVTADSTGHGVPGAIMSMLNISCLKEAVESKKITSPNEILNHTRIKVIETLANDGSAEGGKDGMDCSLLSFDFKNNILQIAAANNPVWIVRNAGSSGVENVLELIEIKPDKMPVGKHDRDKESFTLKTMDLIKGDIVYTLTDGFPDQFGGENGKKFMSKKLKELLLANAHLSMSKQKLILESTFKSWVGNLEQIDDVTVIGVRV